MTIDSPLETAFLASEHRARLELAFSSKYQRVARLRLVRFHLKDILILP